MVPRGVGYVTSLFDVRDWALAANIAAAMLAGLAAVIVFSVLRFDIRRSWVRAFIALLPVLIPLVGLETLQSVASTYILLIYAATIALAFPVKSRGATIGYCVGLGITALTVPTSALLVPVVALQWFRRRLGGREAISASAGLGLGLALQALMMARATDGRNLSVTNSSVLEWVNALPNTVLSFWPGMSFGESSVIFGRFTLAPFPLTGLLIAVSVLGVSTWLLFRPSRLRNGVGILLLMGLAFGAVPSVTNAASNRYLVWTALLWAAAGVITLDRKFPSGRVLPVAMLGLLVIWASAFTASEWRRTGDPAWQVEVERLESICSQPDEGVVLTFSPQWPAPTNVMPALTSNLAECKMLFRA